MKHFFQNSEFPLDEILFEHRNKDYGAYILRKEAGNLMLKAVLAGTGLFVSISLLPLVAGVFKSVPPPTITPRGGKHVFSVVEEPPVRKKEIKTQAPQHKSQEIKEIAAVIPEPVISPPTETPMPALSQYDQAVAGIHNRDGISKPVSIFIPPVNPVAPPALTSETAPEKPKEAITEVEVQASFSGGIDAFRRKVAENFDSSLFSSEDRVLSARLSFIVELDGTISDIRVEGKNPAFNKEAVRTLQKIKTRWIPAKVAGKPVRSYFSMSVSMVFE